MRYVANKQQALILSRKMADRYNKIFGSRCSPDRMGKVYPYDFYIRLIKINE